MTITGGKLQDQEEDSGTSLLPSSSSAAFPSYGAAEADAADNALLVTIDGREIPDEEALLAGGNDIPTAASTVVEDVEPLISAAVADASLSELGGRREDSLRYSANGDGGEGRDPDRPACRDVPFAVLFHLHLAVLIWLGVAVAPKGYEGIAVPDLKSIEDAIRNSSSEGGDENGNGVSEADLAQFEQFALEAGRYVRVYPLRVLRYLAAPLAGSAFLVAFVAVAAVVGPFPRAAVRMSLVMSFALVLAAAAAACLASPTSAFAWVASAAALASVAYYVVAVAWATVPFAAANLKVAVRAIRRNCGIFVVALAFAALSVAWVGFWLYVVVGTFAYMDATCRRGHPDADFDVSSPDRSDACDAPTAIVLLFLVSLLWTTTITMNMIQVTVAGLVATWCYAKEDADHCCSPAVFGSLYRSATYSFGSICLGSLLQAVVSTFRVLVEAARNQRDRSNDGGGYCCGSLLLCILECLASLLEDLIYFFNQYAYIYAGIYGLSYIDSGRKVMDLFRARGWTTIITNNLVGYVLSFTTFGVAVLTGLIGVLLEVETTRYLGNEGDVSDSFLFGPLPGPRYWAFAIGSVIGLWVSSVMMNVVKGAVNTIVVCWADSPTVFEDNHPELTREMAESWNSVFPDIGVYVRPPPVVATAAATAPYQATAF